MQIPKQVLAAQMPSGAKAVLSAMWQGAENTEPPWLPARQQEIAGAAGLAERTVRHWVAYLRMRGAIRKEARELLGRMFDGHGLMRVVPALHKRPGPASATARDGRNGVAEREKPHSHPTDRIEADLAQIAKYAKRSDSNVQICERLLKARAPCSSGTWHKVKVFRRIDRMLAELGDEGRKSLRAGEIVERWKRTR